MIEADDSGRPRDLDDLLVTARLSREVVQAVGLWVGARWANEGFAWVRSRKSWERQGVGRREQVTLASSYRNRAGHRTKIWVESLAVFDSALDTWRRAHPELCVARPEKFQGLLCASSFLDLTSRYSAELSQPEGRINRTEAWIDHVHEIASAWFACTTDAARLAEAASDHMVFTEAPNLVEFAMSRGEREQARLIIERALELRPMMYGEAFEDGRDMARRGVQPQWHSAPCLGWSSVIHDLV